ncbi:ste ste20 ysk protein kinase [Moniliophthora roreri MCA 2997]|uniref:Ste ste20 ysk protein kinase n=1 Tax=Moniliophthora roreri (strain MCA 2997) TaxID=1381753 RepID=V2XP59_MONRO|nr:ste ste20 ysk protein kinase [Moniliophthora roreri MCA 2997]
MNNVTRQGGYPTGWALEEQIIIIQALQFLRNRKVAYRNIRAESMWLNYDRILKLGGFVDSIVMIETSVPSPTTGFRDYWQAPETAYPYLNPYNTFKADMWSLGAVTWALIQGEPPSRDSGPSTLRYSCPALDSGSCSTVLYKFVQRCLANPVGHPDIGRLAKHRLSSHPGEIEQADLMKYLKDHRPARLSSKYLDEASEGLELRVGPTSISGNTLSRAPLLTPPIIRRPLACVPLPSQVDDGTIVELHPILDPREAPSFEWDMSPDSLEKMLRAHPTIKYLLESATNPALPSLAVVHPQLPWPVTVHRSSVNEESVTVFDVLYAVCEALQTPLSAGGRRLDLLGSRPKFVGLRRCELGGDIWELCVL